MKSKFKLTGLSKMKSMTCEPLNNQNIFWPVVGLTQDRFNAFWDYYIARDNRENFFVEIEHEGINEEGIPINGTVTAIIIE